MEQGAGAGASTGAEGRKMAEAALDAAGAITVRPAAEGAGALAARIRADWPGLFMKLAKGVGTLGVSAATGGMVGDPAKAALDLLDPFRLSSEPEALAWNLLRKALVRVCRDLAMAWPMARPLDPVWEARLGERLEAIVAGEEAVTIDPDFFRQPRNLRQLPAFKESAQAWLEALGIEPAAAQAQLQHFEMRFVAALHETWSRDAATYTPLAERLDSPFLPALQEEQAWAVYARTHILQPLQEPLFGQDHITLERIYVPLRAAMALKTTDPETAERQEADRPGPVHGNGAQKRRVVDPEQALMAWAKTAGKDDALRVISGGPGSGKSSFARMLAGKLVEAGIIRVLFFPLQRFRVADKLTEAVKEALAADPAGAQFPKTPLEALSLQPVGQPVGQPAGQPAGRILLILDGLDELRAPGATAQQETSLFVQEVCRTLETFNLTPLAEGRARLLALVCGRTLAVQSVRQSLRAPNAEMELLKYYFSDQERHVYADPDRRLAEDQRQAWWKRYAACSLRNPASPVPESPVPEQLLGADLEALSAEPLLNFLLVLSGAHTETEDNRAVNRNTVYERIFRKIYQQEWRPSPELPGVLTEDEFRRVMETIAMEAWNGGGSRIARLGALEARFAETESLKTLYRKYQERTGAGQGGVQRLVTAFYCRRVDDLSVQDDAIEFTHKSFAEYLTARHFFRELGRICRVLAADPEGVGRREWDKALSDWTLMCGGMPVTADLLRFLRDEAALAQNRGSCEAWRQTLLTLINQAQKEGMPAEPLRTFSFKEATRQARNAEEALFCLLNACLRAAPPAQPVVIAWEDDHGLLRLINRLGTRESENKTPVIRECLELIDAENAYLRGSDMGEANLARSYLSDANLSGANLSYADLFDADISDANLRGANLSGANLSYANLFDAVLSDANLSGANLHRAILSGAIIVGVRGLSAEARAELEQRGALSRLGDEEIL